MQIQVNTDNHTTGSEKLTRDCEAVVERALGRFADRITRVEIHLSDENSAQKSGEDDRRCRMEARVAGRQPLAVSASGSSLEQALQGAVDKLEKSLTSTLGRLDDAKGRPSFGGDQSE